MPEKTFSQSWFRVASLKPRLAAQARIHRQVHRGETWYLLQDVSTQNFYRIGPSAYRFVGLLDGRHSVHEIWEILNEQLGDDAPGQDEVIRLLSHLHTGNVLLCDLPPDIEQMFERYKKFRKAKIKGYLLNPLFARIPLLDPDRFLQRWSTYVRPLFSWWGALVWLATLTTAIAVAISHWSALTHEITDQILAANNLLYLWLTFAAIKGVHELAHGFACRVRGGEVHEMGIMFLVFTPVPYVETSSSWAFPRKVDRLVVAAAGMLAELFVAALAMLLWVNVEPGVVRSVAYNAIFLASVTTLLFNANPLLRYDGYYILSDLLEMPNLRKRSSEYIKYLLERHLFGLKSLESPASSTSEVFWLVGYGIGSLVYRVFISIAIVLFVASQFLAVGVILALMAGISWGIVPLVKGMRYILTDLRLAPVRKRAVLVSMLLLALILIPLGVLPAPFSSRTEGVVFIPEHSILRARSPGFVSEVLAKPGTRVAAGDVVVECRNPDLENLLVRVQLRIAEMMRRYQQLRVEDRVEAEAVVQQAEYLRSLEADLQKRTKELFIRSPADGVLVLPQAEDLPGRFLEEGAEVGRVVDTARIVVRTIVPQSEIDLVRDRLRGVEVRFAGSVDHVFTAEITRQFPAGIRQLPSSALGILGGGRTLVDPTDPSGARALEPHFVLDLRLSGEQRPNYVGERAFVRFDLGRQPLASQWARSIRQLLLDRFEL